MPWCSNNFSHADALSWIEEQTEARKRGLAYEFALIDSEGHYLGGGGINSIRTDHNFANIGYWIRSSRTCEGLGTLALKASVAWARRNTKLKRLEVVVATGNLASQRVAEKAGAVKESIAESRLYLHGVYHDATMYVFIDA